MKIFRSIVAFVVCLCAGINTVNANEPPACISQIMTNDQGVFVLVDSCWLQTEGVLATSEGVHVLLDNEWVPLPEAGSRKSNNYVWICPICGTTNIHTGLPCSNSENHPDEDEQSEDE